MFTLTDLSFLCLSGVGVRGAVRERGGGIQTESQTQRQRERESYETHRAGGRLREIK